MFSQVSTHVRNVIAFYTWMLRVHALEASDLSIQTDKFAFAYVRRE